MPKNSFFRNFHLNVMFPVFLGTIIFLYIVIAYFGERSMTREHVEKFNDQQALQTLVAANGIQQSYNQVSSTGDALIKHVKTIVEIEPKPEKALVNFIRSIVDSHSEIMGIALYLDDNPHAIRWFDDNQVARNISEAWRDQFGKGITREKMKFVPPLCIRSDMQYYGIIMNGSTHDHSFQLITVVDLLPGIERYVVPLRSGQYGAGYILDGLGNIVFDHETEIIGRNVFDGMHDPYEELMKIDKRLISESFGTGRYAFTVARGGAVTRKIIAWHSATIGDQRLVIALSTPLEEVNRDLEQLRLQLYILASLFAVSILAGTLVYFRYVSRRAQQNRTQFLKEVMDAIPDMFYFKDRERRFVGCNSAFAEFIRHPVEDIVGKGFYELFPDYQNRYYDSYEIAVLEKGITQRFEERNTTFHPTITVMDTILTPLFDAQGKVDGIVGVSRDISERHEIQQRFMRSEKRYNMAQQAAGVASWEWDIEKDIVTFSPEAIHLLDLAPDKLTLAVPEIEKAIVNDDLESCTELINMCRKGIDDFQVDIRFRFAAKGIQWFSIRGSRLRSEPDGSDRYMGVIQNITARKFNEIELKQFARAIDHAGEIIIITGADGRLSYVNPAFEKITGFEKDEVIGETLGFLKSGKHSPEFYRQIFQSIVEGKTWRGTFINKRKDGTLFEVEGTISPIRDQNGRIVKFVGVLKDITLEKELKQQLMHTQKMEAIGTLAGGIAHDFNNILSAVIGYGELAVLDVPPDNPSYRGIQEIVKAGYRAKEVIQQILTFSRRSDSERKPVQMKSIVEEIYNMLKTTLPANIEMRIDIQTDGLIYGDPSRLHQILMNLCTNSYQAMKPDGGILTIRLTETDNEKIPSQYAHNLKSGDYIKLSVIDTGCGMSPDLMKRIFEPYFTTKGHSGGTGLGLSTVHGIIRDYNGAIDVQSKPNSGTVIDVYLPMLTSNALIKSRKQEVFNTGEIYRILFVDDDPNIASMIKIGVNRVGHQIITFTDPENALNFYRNDPWQFDLVVSDISMPKISGLDLLLEVRNTRPELPVILCTGHDSFADLDAAYRTGADLIIMKPITWQILIEKINELMQQKKS